MRTRPAIFAALATLVLTPLLAGCTSEADRASQNLSTEAEQFKVERRILFINGITDNVMLKVEGRCSVETADSALKGALEVTCRVGEDQYKKHYLYLSDNVTATIEQLDPIDVSVYHYEFVVKPENLLPDVQIDTGKQ
jgi:hypothetical protein